MSIDMTEAIRTILREHGRLAEDVATLSDQSDLFQAGLTSHASVNVDARARRALRQSSSPSGCCVGGAFASIAAIRAGLERADRSERMTPADGRERPARSGAAHRRRRRRPRGGRGRSRGALSARGHRRAARGADARRARSARARRAAARRSARSARVCEALGRSCASTAMIYAMHQIEVACLVRHGLLVAFLSRLPRRARASASGSSRRRRRRSASAATCAAASARSSATARAFGSPSRRRSSRTARRRTTSC